MTIKRAIDNDDNTPKRGRGRPSKVQKLFIKPEVDPEVTNSSTMSETLRVVEKNFKEKVRKPRVEEEDDESSDRLFIDTREPSVIVMPAKAPFRNINP